jgi:hypothetical protein
VALFLILIDIISVRHYNKYIATKDYMETIKRIVCELTQRLLYLNWQFTIVAVIPVLSKL